VQNDQPSHSQQSRQLQPVLLTNTPALAGEHVKVTSLDAHQFEREGIAVTRQLKGTRIAAELQRLIITLVCGDLSHWLRNCDTSDSQENLHVYIQSDSLARLYQVCEKAVARKYIGNRLTIKTLQKAIRVWLMMEVKVDPSEALKRDKKIFKAVREIYSSSQKRASNNTASMTTPLEKNIPSSATSHTSCDGDADVSSLTDPSPRYVQRSKQHDPDTEATAELKNSGTGTDSTTTSHI